MDLNFQLTTQTKLLLGVLLLVLIAAIASQWGPGLYSLITNPEMDNKRQSLQTAKDLVMASKTLKPVESDLYKKTGLVSGEETKHIFEDSFPDTVIRTKIDAIVKQAGIPQNYQTNLEAIPGKKIEKISPQARRNLVVYLYQKKLEKERDTINAVIQAETEDEEQGDIEIDMETMDMLMNAWLNETDEDPEDMPKEDNGSDEYNEDEKSDEDHNDEKSDENHNDEKSDENHNDEKSDENHNDESENTEIPSEDEQPNKNKGDPKNHQMETVEGETKDSDTSQQAYNDQTDTTNSTDGESQWKFVSFPDSMPIYMQLELIDYIFSMTEQHLVGAEKTLFKNQYETIRREATSGFFGIGAKKPITEIYFRPNSQILAKYRQLIDFSEEELDESKLTAELLEYLERIESQIKEFSEMLKMAPTSYTPESYTIRLKFKADVDKLVNLNRLIETETKWLMVRDLQIAADKDNKINVDVLMIARVYQ